MKALFVALAGLSLACGGSPTSPSGLPLSQNLETSSYLFHYSQGDRVDSEWQERYHAWAIQALQVSVSRRIVYNKYVSLDHMGQLTRSYGTNAFADRQAFAIHTLWPVDNHEVIHLFGSLFGDPVALWSEGMAVAFQMNAPAGDFVATWNGTPVHTRAAQFQQQGRLVPIDSLLETRGFRNFDSDVTYPQAGSFVRYLLDTYGLETWKQLYGKGGPNDAAADVRAHFAAVYGRTVASAEADWLTMIGTR
jgi:hypothetical protein